MSCGFISSYDGVMRCSHTVHSQGFCRFHYQALQMGEITLEGYIVDSLSDQVRRRKINFHGVQPPDVQVGPGSTADSGECDEPDGG